MPSHSSLRFSSLIYPLVSGDEDEKEEHNINYRIRKHAFV